MRDQVVPQKVGNRSGFGAKGRPASATQRPARRGRDSSQPLGARLRALLGYVPIALKFAMVAIIGVLTFVGYRAAASASFFQIRTVETGGTIRASVEAIQTAVRHDVAPTGVWNADLQEISKHLERLPWVRTAVVTRVLPDGIRVRITERQQRAVVRTSSGRFMWVDDDAVYLGEMSSTDQMPDFFLRGWNEDESPAAQTENRERVRKFLDLQREWSEQGLTERVSEVNLMDVRDVRAQLAGDDSQIEVRLGAQDHGIRLKKALNVLDNQRQTARGPLISYIDLSQGKRAIVGLVTGSHAVSDDPIGSPEQNSTGEPERKNERAASKPVKDKDSKARKETKKADQKRT